MHRARVVHVAAVNDAVDGLTLELDRDRATTVELQVLRETFEARVHDAVELRVAPSEASMPDRVDLAMQGVLYATSERSAFVSCGGVLCRAPREMLPHPIGTAVAIVARRSAKRAR